ncbi:uncharacterized protein AAEQ78_020607 [Lycaon pictus]
MGCRPPPPPAAAGRALPPQWPRPRQEAGNEPAGPPGRILPLRRRRRRGRYHGDRGGRPGLAGSGPPGVRRGAVGCRGPGARQARPTGWARCPRRKPRLNWGRRGIRIEGGLGQPPGVSLCFVIHSRSRPKGCGLGELGPRQDSLAGAWHPDMNYILLHCLADRDFWGRKNNQVFADPLVPE